MGVGVSSVGSQQSVRSYTAPSTLSQKGRSLFNTSQGQSLAESPSEGAQPSTATPPAFGNVSVVSSTSKKDILEQLGSLKKLAIESRRQAITALGNVEVAAAKENFAAAAKAYNDLKSKLSTCSKPSEFDSVAKTKLAEYASYVNDEVTSKKFAKCSQLAEAKDHELANPIQALKLNSSNTDEHIEITVELYADNPERLGDSLKYLFANYRRSQEFKLDKNVVKVENDTLMEKGLKAIYGLYKNEPDKLVKALKIAYPDDDGQSKIINVLYKDRPAYLVLALKTLYADDQKKCTETIKKWHENDPEKLAVATNVATNVEIFSSALKSEARALKDVQAGKYEDAKTNFTDAVTSYGEYKKAVSLKKDFSHDKETEERFSRYAQLARSTTPNIQEHFDNEKLVAELMIETNLNHHNKTGIMAAIEAGINKIARFIEALGNFGESTPRAIRTLTEKAIANEVAKLEEKLKGQALAELTQENKEHLAEKIKTGLLLRFPNYFLGVGHKDGEALVEMLSKLSTPEEANKLYEELQNKQFSEKVHSEKFAKRCNEFFASDNDTVQTDLRALLKCQGALANAATVANKFKVIQEFSEKSERARKLLGHYKNDFISEGELVYVLTKRIDYILELNLTLSVEPQLGLDDEIIVSYVGSSVGSNAATVAVSTADGASKDRRSGTEATPVDTLNSAGVRWLNGRQYAERNDRIFLNMLQKTAMDKKAINTAIQLHAESPHDLGVSLAASGIDKKVIVSTIFALYSKEDELDSLRKALAAANVQINDIASYAVDCYFEVPVPGKSGEFCTCPYELGQIFAVAGYKADDKTKVFQEIEACYFPDEPEHLATALLAAGFSPEEINTCLDCSDDINTDDTFKEKVAIILALSTS